MGKEMITRRLALMTGAAAISRRWTWKPTLANTQGLMTLQFPGSTHQSVTLRSVAGSINLIKADSLVGDFDISQIT